jgi:hypothetical protein
VRLDANRDVLQRTLVAVKEIQTLDLDLAGRICIGIVPSA